MIVPLPNLLHSVAHYHCYHYHYHYRYLYFGLTQDILHLPRQSHWSYERTRLRWACTSCHHQSCLYMHGMAFIIGRTFGESYVHCSWDILHYGRVFWGQGRWTNEVADLRNALQEEAELRLSWDELALAGLTEKSELPPGCLVATCSYSGILAVG